VEQLLKTVIKRIPRYVWKIKCVPVNVRYLDLYLSAITFLLMVISHLNNFNFL
jgi:hypothetical protein